MTILLAILVDLPSPMIPAKVQPKGILGSEEEIFKGFYHIWAGRPSWSTDRDHFSKFSFPHPKEAPYEIWAKLAQRLQRSCLKFWTFFPYKCIRKQNWPYRKKVKCQCTTIFFSNFGSSPVPKDICKDSAIRHARFWRRRFLNIFPIQMHREANLTLP